MSRIDEIRDRLDKATPGPWEATYEPSDRWTSITGQAHDDGGRWLLCPEVATCEGEGHTDADLIANAPADLAWLLGEVERLSAERMQPEQPEPTDAEVEAALWAWISSAAEGVTRENVSPRVLDLNRPRARAALLAARKVARHE